MTAFLLSADTAQRQLAGVCDPDRRSPSEWTEVWARVVWNFVTEPGDGAAGRLIAERGARDALRALLEDRLVAEADVVSLTARELHEGVKRWTPRLTPDAIAHSVAMARAAGVTLVVPSDAHWPRQLDDLGDNAPLALWVRGDPATLARLAPSVALVGARAASPYGESVAMEMSADLASSGLPVVSGGAYGIDGAAHRAAAAVGGTTVALLAGGADRPYPAGHVALFDRIVVGGAVVSELPCGSAPTRWRFLARNRLIAAVASATVVVEAGWRSGSLNTAGHAAALGRPVGAVPGPVTSAASMGCHRLLREYGATCVTSAAQARELLGMDAFGQASFDFGAADGGRPRTDDTTRVRDALSTRLARSSDDIARRSGMAPDEVEAILGLLLLEGGVQRDGRGWRRLSDRER